MLCLKHSRCSKTFASSILFGAYHSLPFSTFTCMLLSLVLSEASIMIHAHLAEAEWNCGRKKGFGVRQKDLDSNPDPPLICQPGNLR